jgi:hypothetical protein
VGGTVNVYWGAVVDFEPIAGEESLQPPVVTLYSKTV